MKNILLSELFNLLFIYNVLMICYLKKEIKTFWNVHIVSFLIDIQNTTFYDNQWHN